MPAWLTVPAPVTLQVTAVLELPLTWAVNCCGCPTLRVTAVGETVTTTTGCTVTDSDHTHGGGHDSVLFNPVETAPVRIGRGTWLGDRVSVLRGADIGRHCTIGANSVVRGTIPDYSVAVGAPARVVGSTQPGR